MLSKDIKLKIIQQSDGICAYCRKKLISSEFHDIDHIVPRSMGGSDDLVNLAVSCHECNSIRHRRYYKEFVGGADNIKIKFQASVEEVKIILRADIPPPIKTVHNRMVYSSLISAMEAYLSDKLIFHIINDDVFFRRAVESNKDFENKKFNFSNIFLELDKIRETVIDYYVAIVYHNIGKVKQIFKGIFDIEFPLEVGQIYRAVETRHDIVHRHGQTKNGSQVKIDAKEVLELSDILVGFIYEIDSKIEERVLEREEIKLRQKMITNFERFHAE